LQTHISKEKHQKVKIGDTIAVFMHGAKRNYILRQISILEKTGVNPLCFVAFSNEMSQMGIFLLRIMMTLAKIVRVGYLRIYANYPGNVLPG